MTSEPNATILSGVPGSFPWRVFHERHPELVRRVLAAVPYGPRERAAVERLLAESTGGGALEPLPADAHDHARWRAWGGERWYGRPWGEVPFLWAESYFYRRLLEATGYFRPGAWQGVDPFGPVKAAELAGPEVAEELAALDGLKGLPPQRWRSAALRSALWGNRADLSFQLTTALQDAHGLLVDDSELLWSAVERTGHPRICYVADNAGRELLPDLVLIDHLLDRACQVVLHVKPYPYYVSDATVRDVVAAVNRLREEGTSAARRIGERLRSALADESLVLRSHPFLSAPLPFAELPDELRAEFAAAHLTIVKGDLNYRRLVGDRRWDPTTPFAERVAHFQVRWRRCAR